MVQSLFPKGKAAAFMAIRKIADSGESRLQAGFIDDRGGLFMGLPFTTSSKIRAVHKILNKNKIIFVKKFFKYIKKLMRKRKVGGLAQCGQCFYS